jgi:hypothetical protein
MLGMKPVEFANWIAVLSAVAAVISAATSIFQVRLAAQVTNEFLVALESDRARSECARMVELAQKSLATSLDFYSISQTDATAEQKRAKLDIAYEVRREFNDRSVQFMIFAPPGASEKIDAFLELPSLPFSLEQANTLTSQQLTDGVYSQGSKLLIELALMCRDQPNEIN